MSYYKLFISFTFVLFLTPYFFSQENSGGNANNNNNANGNALKWETQGNNVNTNDFIGTTNSTALNSEQIIKNEFESLRIDGSIL